MCVGWSKGIFFFSHGLVRFCFSHTKVSLMQITCIFCMFSLQYEIELWFAHKWLRFKWNVLATEQKPVPCLHGTCGVVRLPVCCPLLESDSRPTTNGFNTILGEEGMYQWHNRLCQVRHIVHMTNMWMWGTFDELMSLVLTLWPWACLYVLSTVKASQSKLIKQKVHVDNIQIKMKYCIL